MDALYIDTPDSLNSVCAVLNDGPWIALDTEFVRERTYFPKLCLIQVANESVVACIDPLALPDLQPLLEVLYNPRIANVFHSARQDLEIFFHLRGTLPAPIFDTQIAATLLGHNEFTGYATLVKDLLGVELDKSQTRTDWNRRPLTDAQLAYAADDVRYLRDIYTHQQRELTSHARLDWLAADFAELCDPATYAASPEQLWQRIKGKQRLRGVQLAVLRALADWRERQAMTADRPRKWILGDEVLLEAARRMPSTTDQLREIRGLESRAIDAWGPMLLERIAAARTEPRETWPTLPPARRLDMQQEALVDAMMAVIRLRGSQHRVSASALASRKDVERLISDGADVPLLHGWRAAIAGEEVQNLLRGKLGLEVHEGTLRIVANS